MRQLRLYSKNDLEYHERKADRSQCPRRQDFNRMYAHFCKDKYGNRNGKEMFESLQERAKVYKEEHAEASIEYQEYEELEENVVPFILVIITPLMKRAHKMVSVAVCC